MRYRGIRTLMLLICIHFNENWFKNGEKGDVYRCKIICLEKGDDIDKNVSRLENVDTDWNAFSRMRL